MNYGVRHEWSVWREERDEKKQIVIFHFVSFSFNYTIQAPADEDFHPIVIHENGNKIQAYFFGYSIEIEKSFNAPFTLLG